MKRVGALSGFVLFLLCAGAALALNPLFWDLLNMEYGAAHYGVVEANGAARAVVHGPKGPWPDWATAPEAAPVRPVVSYSAAPGHPATGFGDASIEAAPLAAARATKAALQGAGWTVEESRFDGAEPSLPPRPLVLCQLMARRDDPEPRTLIYSFQIEPAAASARIHWIEGAPPAAWGRPASACGASRRHAQSR